MQNERDRQTDRGLMHKGLSENITICRTPESKRWDNIIRIEERGV